LMLTGLWADCLIGIGCVLVCTNVSGGWYNLTVCDAGSWTEWLVSGGVARMMYHSVLLLLLGR